MRPLGEVEEAAVQLGVYFCTFDLKKNLFFITKI